MSSTPNKSAYKTSDTLLDRVRDPNDKEAWTEFINYYEQFIYNLLRHINFPQSDAEELSQEIILRLWKKLPEFTYDRDRGKFRNWLNTVIRNEANRFLKSQINKDKIIQTEEQDALERFASEQGAENIDTLINEEWSQYILNLAWESIKMRFQENIQEVFIEYADGVSAKDIAKKFNMKEKTVTTYIFRVKKHLRAEIDKFNEELL